MASISPVTSVDLARVRVELTTDDHKRVALGTAAEALTDSRLTEGEREAIRAIEKSLRKTEKQALRGLDRKEQKTLAKLLSRIETNLSDAAELEPDDEAEAEA